MQKSSPFCLPLFILLLLTAPWQQSATVALGYGLLPTRPAHGRKYGRVPSLVEPMRRHRGILPSRSFVSHVYASRKGESDKRDGGTDDQSSAPRYELGVGKNAPLHLRKYAEEEAEGANATSSKKASTVLTAEEVAKNWIVLEPVKKPVVKPKSASYALGIGKNSPLIGRSREVRIRKIIPKDEEGQLLKGAIWDEGHYTRNDSIQRAVDDAVKEATGGGGGLMTGKSGLVGGLVDGGRSGIRESAPQVNGGSTEEDEPVDKVVEAAAAAAVAAMLADAGKDDDEGAFAADPRLEFTNEPPIRHEDIDLSVPTSIYDPDGSVDAVWDLMKYEARVEAKREPLLVSFLHSTILNHPSLESALAFHLANKLSSPAMIGTQIMSLIMEALGSSPEFRRTLRADMLAVRDRDPACTCLPDVFLYFKGFHALQTHRVAHYLWNSGRRVLAHYLQSQVSQNFQIDIHPNATLGSGIMLDHGTGIVIGQTAAMGHNCSILHHVTLGGSGKKGVDRHPKVGNGVLLGAGASILGNIHIGDGCQVGAGTLVIKDLPPHTVAVGVPAKIIGSFVDVSAQPSIGMNQIGSKEADATIITFETEGI